MDDKDAFAEGLELLHCATILYECPKKLEIQVNLWTFSTTKEAQIKGARQMEDGK